MSSLCYNPPQGLIHPFNLHSHPRSRDSNLRYFFEDISGYIHDHILFMATDRLKKATDNDRSKRRPTYLTLLEDVAFSRKKFIIKRFHDFRKSWETLKKRMPLPRQGACCGQSRPFLPQPLIIKGRIKESLQESRSST